MSSQSDLRQYGSRYAGITILTLAVIAGCGDSVPPSPNPPQAAVPGGRDPGDPKSLLKPRTPVPDTKRPRKG